MDFALVYLVQRFFYRFLNFFHHWYVDGTRYLAHKFVGALQDVDRTFAIAITLRHFFEPLYKDYSAVGRVLGVIFRTGRVILACIVYFIFGFLFMVAFLIWLLIPAVIIFYAARGL